MAGIRENLSLETWTILGALVSRIEHTPSFTCINSCDFHYPGKLNSEKQIMLQFLNRHQISLCFKIRICLKIMISVRFPEGKINIFSILNLPIIPFSGHLFGKIRMYAWVPYSVAHIYLQEYHIAWPTFNCTLIQFLVWFCFDRKCWILIGHMQV